MLNTLQLVVLILSVAGLVLPPRYAVRLGVAGVVVVLAFGIYGNTPFDPGAGHALGVYMIWLATLTFFGAILLGLFLRAVWAWVRGTDWFGAQGPFDPVVDAVLIGFAMLLPAGLAALLLGALLAGSAHPVPVHLGLIAALVAVAITGFYSTNIHATGALLGFSLWAAIITTDSMRLDGKVQRALKDSGTISSICLAIGPNFLAPEAIPKLMGLTAPKPILLLTGEPGQQRVLRWSFRYHGFVRTGIDPASVLCPDRFKGP